MAKSAKRPAAKGTKNKAELQQPQLSSENYQQVALEAEQLRGAIADKLKQCAGIQFSDEDVHAFAMQISRKPETDSEEVTEFIDGLVASKNITDKQRQKFFKEYKIKDQAKKAKTPGKEKPR